MIGNRIKSIRELKKISQQDLVNKINALSKSYKINQSQISKIENGSRKLKAEETILFAQALEVDIFQLLEQQSA
ncbi:helix-turn-helix domain-containing protein [Tepidibacter formicigenes]|jgi:transcriptional regulator with XRE-family HTH domain|uniref:Helix-turn-helix domain-containing protein n=1 Tax=Tepidibacter formicigenes DSM 15518 TaxID=1123349 RepID=A0A1M6SM76_9FIRM|nr:helix-turn-helix transcriptional regulator [Tepidibacter formicigenes]SHK45688.1 Helix-turn-helix domain-containing protein [Tepidibacter formicigenes DSM 15518]